MSLGSVIDLLVDSRSCGQPPSFSLTSLTSGLVIWVFDDSYKVGADVVLLHGCPQSCMQNPAEGLLEVYEDMVEVLLVLKIFLTDYSWVEDLLCGAPFCSEACLFFRDDILRLCLQSVQYDLRLDFAWVTDEADRSVVLKLLHGAFLGKCDDKGLGPWGWPFSGQPDLIADCRESGDYIRSTCLDQFCWDVIDSSRLPFLQ